MTSLDKNYFENCWNVLIWGRKKYFWRAEINFFQSHTKKVLKRFFWGRAINSSLGKNNDENYKNILLWDQKIYFWSQNYTSQTKYFYLEILQHHPWWFLIYKCRLLSLEEGVTGFVTVFGPSSGPNITLPVSEARGARTPRPMWTACIYRM